LSRQATWLAFVQRSFRSTLALACIIAVSTHATVMAGGGPSFDCGKAHSNSTRLICGDTFLMALDLRLVDAYRQRLAKVSGLERVSLVAQQRAWLSGNETACQAPDPRNAGFAETVAPRLCLSQRYLDRLAALGAWRANAPKNTPDAHPRCVQLLGEVLADGQSEAALPLAQCDRVYRSEPVRQTDSGWLEAVGATPFVPWFRYKPVVKLSDGSEAVVADWSVNGAGYKASDILKLREEGTGQGRILTAQMLVQGGSNCQRGILDARSAAGGTFDVVFAITPYDLVVSVSPSLRTKEGLSALTGSSGATKDACVGRLVERYAAPYVNGTIDRAALTLPIATAGSPIDDCFARIFSAGGSQQKTVLDSTELRLKTDAFARRCLTQAK
jgi:uncharacterized protein YecT (DUF1311 family)